MDSADARQRNRYGAAQAASIHGLTFNPAAFAKADCRVS